MHQSGRSKPVQKLRRGCHSLAASNVLLNICMRKIRAFEQQRDVESLRHRIGATVAEIQPRLRVDAFSKTAIRIERKRNMRLRKWHDLDAEFSQEGHDFFGALTPSAGADDNACS